MERTSGLPRRPETIRFRYSLARADLKTFVGACVFDDTSVKNERELLQRFGKK